jgi:hypothetical protein
MKCACECGKGILGSIKAWNLLTRLSTTEFLIYAVNQVTGKQSPGKGTNTNLLLIRRTFDCSTSELRSNRRLSPKRILWVDASTNGKEVRMKRRRS